GLEIRADEPFLTLSDTKVNPINPVRTAIQNVGGSLVFYPNSSFATQTAAAVVADGGNVGIGPTTPAHRLSIAGGPTWTANGWKGAVSLSNQSAIGWEANAAGDRFGIGHTEGGLFLFNTTSNPGTAVSPADYVLSIGDNNVTAVKVLQITGG